MTAAFVLPWRVQGWAAVARQPVLRDRANGTASPEVTALRGRDPRAWTDLFEQEMPAIFRYARARLGAPERAEDATSEVFEQAWRSADHLRDEGLPPRAWLFGIAKNVVGSHGRRWLRQPPHLTLEEFDAPAPAGFTAEAVDLLDALRRLPGKHAEVITLRFLHGLSLQETAAVLETSVDGVKGRQARALAELRAVL